VQLSLKNTNIIDLNHSTNKQKVIVRSVVVNTANGVGRYYTPLVLDNDSISQFCRETTKLITCMM